MSENDALPDRILDAAMTGPGVLAVLSHEEILAFRQLLEGKHPVWVNARNSLWRLAQEIQRQMAPPVPVSELGGQRDDDTAGLRRMLGDRLN
jgi:hypothetical protein